MKKYSKPTTAEFQLVQNGLICESPEVQQNVNGVIYDMSITDLSGDL